MPNFWDDVEGDPVADDYGEDEGYGDTGKRGPHDIVVLDGTALLAIAKVKCVVRIRLDMPKKIDRDGANIIERGHEPATVEIELQIVTPKQWEQFLEVMDRLWRLPGQAGESADVQVSRDKKDETLAVRAARDAAVRKAAISIFHPSCWCKGVSEVVLEEWDGPDIDDRGVGTVRLRARQYIPFAQQRPATKNTRGTGKQVQYSPVAQKAINSLPPPPSKGGATARKPDLP